MKAVFKTLIIRYNREDTDDCGSVGLFVLHLSFFWCLKKAVFMTVAFPGYIHILFADVGGTLAMLENCELQRPTLEARRKRVRLCFFRKIPIGVVSFINERMIVLISPILA